MTERPILFNDSMVRAILAGRKTQTRRPFKPPKWVHPDEIDDFVSALNKYGGSCAKRGPCDGSRAYTGPFGVTGGRLWVRECFATDIDGCERGLSYRADHRDPRGDGPANPMRWTPSIHMPRWASRLTLTVELVCIERLHEITEDDAKAEGVEPIGIGGPYQADCWDDGTYKTSFNFAWGNIYGFEHERGDYGWAANPLVWVLTFKVAEVGRG